MTVADIGHEKLYKLHSVKACNADPVTFINLTNFTTGRRIIPLTRAHANFFFLKRCIFPRNRLYSSCHSKYSDFSAMSRAPADVAFAIPRFKEIRISTSLFRNYRVDVSIIANKNGITCFRKNCNQQATNDVDTVGWCVERSWTNDVTI